MPELLAPAGSFDSLIAAVQNGADAVYLGLKTSNNARMGAENFTIEELREAVRYAHIRGVRVHLALNTILCQNEIETSYQTAREAVDCGVDALILQDIGLAGKILKNRQDFPCEIHASTQMSVYNVNGLHLLKSMGFDRCITARELSIEEIRTLCASSVMDVEVFCHGALCMSISGQCLLSSFIGGRSGNRGTCAQPCRKKYALCRDGTPSDYAYRLSPSDFAALPQIRQLAAAGVRSLKIEGRLKSPAYVAMVSKYYRQAIDDTVEDISCKMRDMQLLFGRADFTSGYLLGKMPFSAVTYYSAGRMGLLVGSIAEFPKKLPAPKGLPQNLTRYSFTVKLHNSHNIKTGDGVTLYTAAGREIIGGGTVNRVTYCKNGLTADIIVVGSLSAYVRGPYTLSITEDPALIECAESTLHGENKKVPVQLFFEAHAGKQPRLTITDEQGRCAAVQADAPAEAARSAPTTTDNIRRQLVKLGDTPYAAAGVELDIDGNIFMPVSALNALRRCGIEQLSELRAIREHFTAPKREQTVKIATPAETGISLFFYHEEAFYRFRESDIPDILKPYRNEPRTYYLPMALFYRDDDKIKQLKRESDCKMMAYFPFISIASDQNPLPENADGFLCENLGDLDLIRYPAPRYCDYSFNVANRYSMEQLALHGATRATLSPETDVENVGLSGAAVNPEIIVGGRIILMRSRHCYIDEGHCGGLRERCAKHQYSLKDEYGCEFPILPQREDCCSILLSHKPVQCTAADVKKIRSICPEATLRINFD